jgi:hypothetical protein
VHHFGFIARTRVSSNSVDHEVGERSRPFILKIYKNICRVYKILSGDKRTKDIKKTV